MVALSFKRRFVEPIRVGLMRDEYLIALAPFYPKRQTIRAERKDGRRPKEGETLQLYCGMRTRQCFLIGKARCLFSCDITLLFDDDPEMEGVVSPGFGLAQWGYNSLDAFAQGDGFKDWQELKSFWAAEHPTIREFVGVITFWEPLDVVPATRDETLTTEEATE